ncbi:putative hydrolase YutF [bacterium BMS3Bbin02]|nr:putative hydrolase YutF [bacterium BMS3Bbin02]
MMLPSDCHRRMVLEIRDISCASVDRAARDRTFTDAVVGSKAVDGNVSNGSDVGSSGNSAAKWKPAKGLNMGEMGESFEGIRTIVCDLDGVLYVDSAGVAGAGNALRTLVADGYALLFVTNNATKTPSMVAEHIADRTGFQASVDHIVTSSQATAHYLKNQGLDNCFVVGEVGLRQTLSDAGLTLVDDWTAAETVVTGLDRDLTYRRIADATLAVRGGATFVATNLDPTYPTPAGLQPGGGAVAAMVEAAAEVAPVTCGKPYGPMRELIAQRRLPGGALVVGDRMDTDIAMAVAEGWFGALVLSGATGADSAPAETAALMVLDSIAALPDRLRKRGVLSSAI